MSTHCLIPKEIQDRIQKGYLERLSDRVKYLRKLLIDRQWAALRGECAQLKLSAASFGLKEVAEKAERVELAIPDGNISKARNLPGARLCAESLFATIDTVTLDRTSQDFQ